MWFLIRKVKNHRRCYWGRESWDLYLLRVLGFHCKTIDEPWDVPEGLVSNTDKFEEVSYVLRLSFLDPCALHTRYLYEDQFVESCTSSPQSFEHASFLCSCCKSFDLNTNTCPYVALYELNAWPRNWKPKIINGEHEYMCKLVLIIGYHFKGMMPVSHDIGLSVGIPLPKICHMYDFEYSSSFSLKLHIDALCMTLRVTIIFLSLLLHGHLCLRLAFLWTFSMISRLSLTLLLL